MVSPTRQITPSTDNARASRGGRLSERLTKTPGRYDPEQARTTHILRGPAHRYAVRCRNQLVVVGEREVSVVSACECHRRMIVLDHYTLESQGFVALGAREEHGLFRRVRAGLLSDAARGF